jgi:hypothetical protein
MALRVVRARVYRYIVRLCRQRWLRAECCRNCHRSSGRYQLQPRGTDRQPAKRERPNSDLAGWRQKSRRTNSRLRLGIAPCLEVLVDLPTYFVTLRGQAGSGFSDVAPAIKWQISPVPGVFDLLITAGVALPTGASVIAGPGVQPYLQFPCSRELGGGWGISGMLTSFFIPADQTDKFSQQVTFAIEKKINDRAD